MIDNSHHFDDLSGFDDAVTAPEAAAYIHELSQELIGLARLMRLTEVAAALEQAAFLAEEAADQSSRVKAASDSAA